MKAPASSCEVINWSMFVALDYKGSICACRTLIKAQEVENTDPVNVGVSGALIL